ncbi:hypothetical protein BC833DRAFT_623739 [Globomyces pollinis-pini]|nr:hypothetical protein BC833DRAFT_623739 [Globomyces pollinis-pini]
MKYINVLALAVLSTVTQAQSCSTGSLTAQFDSCKTNSLTDTSGQPGPATAEAACAPLSSNPFKYYTCLCGKYGLIVGCYTNFCAGDPSAASFQNSNKSYCDAAIANTPKDNGLPQLPPKPPASITDSPSSSSNAAPNKPVDSASTPGKPSETKNSAPISVSNDAMSVAGGAAAIVANLVSLML